MSQYVIANYETIFSNFHYFLKSTDCSLLQLINAQCFEYLSSGKAFSPATESLPCVRYYQLI